MCFFLLTTIKGSKKKKFVDLFIVNLLVNKPNTIFVTLTCNKLALELVMAKGGANSLNSELECRFQNLIT